MAQTDGGSRRLDGRADIEAWLAERRRELDELLEQDELARLRAQLTLDLDDEVAA
jgi:hypothetical protein